MAYMTMDTVIATLGEKGNCTEGIQWVADNDIDNVKEMMDNSQNASWLFWIFILTGYDMDNAMQLVGDTMPQTDLHVAYMEKLLAETDIQSKADMANEIFVSCGEAHCDIIRANTVVEGAPLAYSLDGIDEFVEIDDVGGALAATTVGTWSIWVKPVDISLISNESLIAFGDTDTADRYIIMRTVDSGKIDIIVRYGDIKWRIKTDDVVLGSGVWSHVVIVQGGVSPVLYFDSVAIDQTFLNEGNKAWSISDAAYLDNARIGCGNWGGLGNIIHFNGNVTKALFINRALTQPQVADITNEGTPKDESGIADGVSLLPLGDGDTFPISSDSIGSNDGAMVNMEAEDIVEDSP